MVAGRSHAEEMPITFATGEYSPFTSATLPEYGATTALVSTICQAAGIRPVYQFYPWKRAEIVVADGKAFAAFAL